MADSPQLKARRGLNNYKLSVKEWVAQTNAIVLVASHD